MAAADSAKFLLDDLLQQYETELGTTVDVIYVISTLYSIKKVLDFVLSCLDIVKVYLFQPGSVGSKDLPTYFGEWAVISGATSTLGLAFAEELACRGMKLVLLGKSRSKLQEAVNNIKLRYKSEVVAIQVNYSVGQSLFQDIQETIGSYEIGILVNNMSLTYNHPKYLTELHVSRIWQMINVNVSGVTLLTHMLLGKMIQRGRGAIINICPSAPISMPHPLYTGYSSTIAYVDHFSRALQLECSSKGVIVQSLLPVSVTESTHAEPSWFSPRPRTYVKHALSTLGVTSRTHGYFPHSLQAYCTELLPMWLRIWAVKSYNKRMRKIGLAEAQEKKVQVRERIFSSRSSMGDIQVIQSYHSTSRRSTNPSVPPIPEGVFEDQTDPNIHVNQD